MEREFFIPGPPQGKGRPKFARHGSFVKTYTPDKTASYESLIKAQYHSAYPGEMPLTGEVIMDIIARFEIPKSASKRQAGFMRSGAANPTKKPDADNIAKVVCDSLNGIAYHDDTQIIDLRILKQYSDKPGVLVSFHEVYSADASGLEG